MKKITLILPIYRGKEMAEKCLESIEANTKYPYEIIIIADGCIEVDYTDLIYHDNTTIVLRQYKEGIVSAYNLGMRITNNDVCLIQNDAIYPKLDDKCWLTRLVEASYKLNVGMVGCKSSVRDKPQHGYIGSWCCFIPRKTINKVGYLDEKFNPAMVDDIDYCRRVQIHGLKITTEDFEVEHKEKSRDSNTDEKLKQEHWKLYEEKWKDYKEDMDIEEIKKYDYWR